jgi:pre-rRNA-processing protein TSR3
VLKELSVSVIAFLRLNRDRRFSIEETDSNSTRTEVLNREPRVFTVEFRQDDPAKCTSAKMAKFQLATPIRENHIPHDAIVLDPFADSVLSSTDSDLVKLHGLVVIDCSWVKASTAFSRGKHHYKGNARRLPALLAGNPTNYAKLHSLSSVEAAAATLYITGFKAQARRLLSIYKWGDTFLSLNQAALDDYASASNAEELTAIEKDYFPNEVPHQPLTS